MGSVNKNVNKVAARLAGASPEMDAAIAKAEAAVAAELAGHRRTGQFASTVRTKKVRNDRYLYTDDNAAWNIEFGHKAPDGSWVRGIFAFSNAARKLAR